MQVNMEYTGNNFKIGFTLAEMLITLAIIGVVAAITIPSIVANHQKKALEVGLAKAYRTLSHAVNMATAEHGAIETWSWDGSMSAVNFTNQYILQYLNISKICRGSSALGCFPDVYYKKINGENLDNYNQSNATKAILKDGTLIAITRSTKCLENRGRCVIIKIDTNGFKKPNMAGYDIHEFAFWPETGEMLPTGIYHDNSWNEEIQSYQKVTPEESYDYCYNKKNGWYCTAVAIQDGFKINY